MNGDLVSEKLKVKRKCDKVKEKDALKENMHLKTYRIKTDNEEEYDG
jgi:hypothetical protein